MRKLEAQEIRALRQAVELELDYRKQMDAAKASSAPPSLDGELHAQRITILRIGAERSPASDACQSVATVPLLVTTRVWKQPN